MNDEAAKRLLDAIDAAWNDDEFHQPTAIAAIEAHDAAERRATVERIRARFGMPHTEAHGWDSGPLCQYCPGPGYDAILDEEAER